MWVSEWVNERRAFTRECVCIDVKEAEVFFLSVVDFLSSSAYGVNLSVRFCSFQDTITAACEANECLLRLPSISLNKVRWWKKSTQSFCWFFKNLFVSLAHERETRKYIKSWCSNAGASVLYIIFYVHKIIFLISSRGDKIFSCCHAQKSIRSICIITLQPVFCFFFRIQILVQSVVAHLRVDT